MHTNLIAGLRPRTTVLRFFCRDARNSTLETGIKAPMDAGMTSRATTPIVEAFLYQMLDQCRQLFSSISTYSSRQPSTFGPGDIQAMFRQVLASQESGHIILIIDGLDECDDAFIREFLEYLDLLIRDKLTRTASESSNLIKILFTCQPIGPIPLWLCRYTSIHIQLQDLSQDIDRYIKDEVRDIARSRNYQEDLKQLTEEVLVKLAGRMFLWAYFMLQELREVSVVSPAAIASTIFAFPQDLDRYYRRTLSRIVQRPRSDLPREQDSAMMLLVVIFSLRDLETKEIAEILAVSEDRRCRDEMIPFINTDIRTLVETQLAPLIALDGDFLMISHYSIYEYFESIRPTKLFIDGMDIAFDPDDTNGHLIMAELCLRYLLLDDFAALPASNVGKWKALDERFPLLIYASCTWFVHVSRAGRNLDRILPLARLFLDTKSANYRLWDNIYHAFYESKTTGPPTPVLSTLVRLNLFPLYEILYNTQSDHNHALSTFGYWRNMLYDWFNDWPKGDHLVPTIGNLNEIDRKGYTALHVAIIRGHNHWLEFLICKGADLSVRTPDGWSALHLTALASSDVACARTLLQDNHGLDVDDSGYGDATEDSCTPLCVAAESGNSSTASLLLQHNANIDPNVPEAKRPLFLAAKHDHQDTALIFLRQKPQLTLRDEDGNTLLHFAACYDMPALASYLALNLDDSAVDQRNHFGQRPLQIAAMDGHTEVVRLLIAHGAEIESENDIYDTGEELIAMEPLALALQKGQTSSALLLLDKGATWKLESWSDWTLLHEAAKARNLQMVKRLQQQGMNINQANSIGETPLYLATLNRDVAMVTYILSLNPDLDPALVDDLITPLQMAAYLGSSVIVTMLLEHGADVSIKNKDGNSALCAAALAPQRDVLEVIIRYDTDLDSPNNIGATPLLFCVERRATDCVSLLLNAGASTASSKKSSRQPLHEAVAQGDLKIVNLLLDAGADTNGHDRLGYNCFMTACEKGSEEIMEELLRREVDLADCRTVEGRGLYHLAAMSRKLTTLEKVIQLKGLAEIDRPSASGETPFHLACELAGVDFLRKLISKGANPHRLTMSGANAVHWAVLSGDLAKVRYLLTLHLPFTMRNESNDSPLDIACQMGSVDIARALLALGADFKHANRYTGETCLHSGARYGRDDIISLLIAKGVDMEMYDWRSLTPLLRAIIHFRRNATRLLVAAGANLDASDSLGRTAFTLVMKQYHSLDLDSVKAFPSPRLRDVILKNIELSRGNDAISELNLGILARNLLRFQDSSNALRAYFTRLQLPDPSHTSVAEVTEHTIVTHEAICDNCQRSGIVGAR